MSKEDILTTKRSSGINVGEVIIQKIRGSGFEKILKEQSAREGERDLAYKGMWKVAKKLDNVFSKKKNLERIINIKIENLRAEILIAEDNLKNNENVGLTNKLENYRKTLSALIQQKISILDESAKFFMTEMPSDDPRELLEIKNFYEDLKTNPNQELVDMLRSNYVSDPKNDENKYDMIDGVLAKLYRQNKKKH